MMKKYSIFLVVLILVICSGCTNREIETEEVKSELLSLRSELAEALVQQAETLGLSGNLFSEYLLHCLAEGGNTAANTIEATGNYGRGLADAV